MNSTLETVIFIVVVVAAVAFRVYRQTREQRWKLSSLWVVPIIMLAVTVLIVAGDATRTGAIAIVAALVGLAIGTGIGYYQGNHTTIRVDKSNRAVFIKIAPIGLALFFGILILRGVRVYAVMNSPEMRNAAPGTLPPMSPTEAMIGSGLMALAAGSVVGLRWFVQRAYDAAPSA